MSDSTDTRAIAAKEKADKRRITVIFYGLTAVAAIAMAIAMYLSR